MKFVLNIRLILKICCLILLIVGLSMLPSVLTAFLYGETKIAWSFLASCAFICAVAMLGYVLARPQNAHIKTRGGFFTVGMGWLAAIFAGALPYLVSGYTDSFCSAFFESAAGFTTTNAYVLNINQMPRAFLMWKAVSHWLGGMGILVFTVSLLPALGASGHKIFRLEVPAPKIDKLTSRISDSAKMLYRSYVGFTVMQFLLLLPSDMSVFDNIICTLGCVSTAGLTSHGAALAFSNSLYVEIIVAIFTIFASINFSLYALAFRGRFREFFHDAELRFFLAMIAIATVLMSASLYSSGTFGTLTKSIRYAFLQVVSFASTTGYSLSNYTLWPPFCLFILFLLMLIGGCSSSTCGSIKAIRVIVMFKLVIRAIYRRIHPRAVVAIKLDGKPVSAEVASQITSFVLAFFVLLLTGTLILSLQGYDLITNLGATLAMLSNTGISFGVIGPAGNYSMFAAPLQLVLAGLMIIGRLEIFTFLILLSPAFWHPDRAAD